MGTHQSSIEDVSRHCIIDEGEEFKKYKDNFKEYSVWYKLGLIAYYLPSYYYYTYLAPSVDRYTYKALRHYLDSKAH